ncbi:MAG: SprT family zinc-dependent metalloprotease [Luteolibacter sp.]
MSEETLQTVAGPAELRRTSRKTLAISVLPNGGLELTAPLDASLESIAARVEKRARWIATQRRKFHEMNATPVQRRYVSGATHRYLGKQYRLKISRGTVDRIRLKGGYFEIEVAGDSDVVKKLLEKWFRKRAEEQFARRMETWKQWCGKHHLPEPHLRILCMPKRWGSAGAGGRIALNPELIHAPARCIDYVIVHEICHLKHPNHNRRFYQLLSVLMPDWKTVKHRLEQTEIS